MLSRELLEVCDLSAGGGTEGYFDGPRAWRIILHRLAGEERTKTDKDYYRTAEYLQRSRPLSDGCTAEEYSKRALSYLVHIRPNLPYEVAAADAAEYLIEMMPKALKVAGRQLRSELRAAGKLTDLMHVAKKCMELVAEEQKASTSQTTLLVSAEEVSGHDVTAMAATTGMPLSVTPTHSRGCNAAMAGGDVKWCPGCPHKNNLPCFCDPHWNGVIPCSVYLNKERLSGICIKARQKNAADRGIECAEIQNPSQSKIEAYKKRISNKRKNAKGKGEEKKTATTPANAAVFDSISIEEFMAGVVDIAAAAHSVDNDEGEELEQPTSEGEEQVEERVSTMLWYVFIPVSQSAPEIVCVTHSSHLYTAIR